MKIEVINERFTGNNHLRIHYNKHKDEFPECKSLEDYEELADYYANLPIEGFLPKDGNVIGFEGNPPVEANGTAKLRHLKYVCDENVFVSYVITPNRRGGVTCSTLFKPNAEIKYYKEMIAKSTVINKIPVGQI